MIVNFYLFDSCRISLNYHEKYVRLNIFMEFFTEKPGKEQINSEVLKYLSDIVKNVFILENTLFFSRLFCWNIETIFYKSCLRQKWE